MSDNDHPNFNEIRHSRMHKYIPKRQKFAQFRNRDHSSAEIAAIAHAENWLTPPMKITRVRLRPWQQIVFWGLRIYIGIMLVIMGWGFFHVTGS